MTEIMKILADFQTREVSGHSCAICGRTYEDDDYKDTIFIGEVFVNARSAHGRCYLGFKAVCDLWGLDYRAAIKDQHDKREAEKPPLGKRPAP